MFWDNFERICREAGTSPSGACVAVGIGQNRPSNWKKNGTIPKQDELEMLAKHLGCSVSDFFVDDENRDLNRLFKIWYSSSTPTSRESDLNKLLFLHATESRDDSGSMQAVKVKPRVSVGDGSSSKTVEVPLTMSLIDASSKYGKAGRKKVADLLAVEEKKPKCRTLDDLDDFERDFIRIYESLDAKTRFKLMSAVYEFDTEEEKTAKK